MNDNKILINLKALRADYPSARFNNAANEIASMGCTAKRVDYHGVKCMEICGDISDQDVIDIFMDECEIKVEPYIVTPGEWSEVFNEGLNENQETVNKKKTCCPPKKDTKDNFNDSAVVSLKECLAGTRKVNDANAKMNLDEILDHVTGKGINESIADMAIQKAVNESEKLNDSKKAKLDEILSNIDPKVYVKVVESLSAKAKSLHGESTVNKKKICEYSMNEIKKMIGKVNEKIADVSSKMAAMNESEGLNNLRVSLDTYNRLKKILEEELAYREAYNAVNEEEDAASATEFKNLNPDAEKDNKEEKKDEPEKTDESDNGDENGDEKDDDEQNPDEDETVELREIIVTLANEEAANNLKDDLVAAGVPEDVIEVAPAEEEEENSDETSDEGAESEEGGENADAAAGGESLDDIFGNADAAAQESAKGKGGKPVNEDEDGGSDAVAEDDDTPADGGENPDDAPADDAPADDTASDDDKKYKLTLTDTDYVDKFKEVLLDLWGLTEDEFVDMVGDIVMNDEGDEDSDNDSTEDEGSDEGGDNGSSDEGDEGPADDEFNPDEIFKGL